MPDGQAWACLGAGDNLAQQNLFGYEIHTVGYGGVARCPMLSGPTAASGGGLDLSLYCFDEVAFDSRVELFDDGWVCARPVDDDEDSRHFRHFRHFRCER